MSEFFYIWLYTVAVNFAQVSLVFMVIAFLLAGFALFFCLIEDEIEWFSDKFSKIKTWFITLAIVAITSNLLIPDTDEIKVIIGGGLAWKTTQVEGVADLPENLVDALNRFLVAVGEEDEDSK